MKKTTKATKATRAINRADTSTLKYSVTNDPVAKRRCGSRYDELYAQIQNLQIGSCLVIESPVAHTVRMAYAAAKRWSSLRSNEDSHKYTVTICCNSEGGSVRVWKESR